MASLNDCMTIARSAILTHQQRQAVIGHNIANVDTEGYHRQVAALATNPPVDPTRQETRTWSFGAGVTVADVTRISNGFKEKQLTDQTGDAAYNSARGSALADLEALMAGTGDASLSSHLDQFWNAWQDVANNPDSLAFRSVLIERSAALTDHIRTLDNRLVEFRTQIAQSDGGAPPTYTGIISTQVSEINTIADDIQNLNDRIAQSSSQFNANDLIDQRQQLINQLAELTDLTVNDTTHEISIGGEVLVTGDGSPRNDLTITGADPISLTLNGNPVTISGGSLGAWIDTAALVDSPGGPVDSLRENIDLLATELMSAVNNVHNSDLSSTGNAYDLDGNRSDWNFFTGSGASDLQVNSIIHNTTNPLLDNPRLIAAAGSLHSSGAPNPGDGSKALEIADIAHTGMAGLGGYTFADYYSGRMAALGASAQTAANQAKDGKTVISMLTDSIQSETGVNLDEEMVDMLSAQHAYEAASRFLSTINDLMDLVINRLGT